VIPSLFLVHTWVPNLYVSASINVPSWTLSCEFLFYLLFPWLHAAIRRIAPGRLWWWAGGLALVVVLLPVAIRLVVPAAGTDMSLVQKWLMMTFPPTRLLEFGLGIVLARIVRTGRWIRVPLPVAGLLVLGGFGQAVVLAPTVFGVTAPLIAPLAVLIGAGATADLRGSRTGLRARWLVWLGELSYAFYLLHYLVLAYVHDLLGYARTWPVPTAVAIFTGLFGVTLLLALALYVLVERPCLRRWATHRHQP
jgi:peptidoglycan/LPS O-acetylase OafA/YrhL